METVGAYEAKTHFSKLLERVAQGERIAIEKHGVHVATLEPAGASQRRPVKEVLDEIRQFRAGHSLDGLTVREMIEEGRR